MTKIKLCGLMTVGDIEVANELEPDYVGFVFVPGSRRFLTTEQAVELKRKLSPSIGVVGVFGQAKVEEISELLRAGVIDIAQLHGDEDDDYIRRLSGLTDRPIMRALKVKTERDIVAAENSIANYVLLDSGAGSGQTFDWEMVRGVRRTYFLAGGLNSENVAAAINLLHPYAVDVSSGIETNGSKDPWKMADFVAAVRRCNRGEGKHD